MVFGCEVTLLLWRSFTDVASDLIRSGTQVRDVPPLRARLKRVETCFRNQVMRVALVTPAFPVPRPGRYLGIERLAKDLAVELRGHGLALDIITTFWNGGDREDWFGNTRISRVSDSSRWLGRWAAIGDSHYWTWGFAVGHWLRIHNRPDVVHTLCPVADTPGLVRAGFPVVTTFHHFSDVGSWRDLLHRPLHRVLEDRAYRTATLLTAPSRASADVLERRFGVPPPRIRVVPWGINASKFQERRHTPGSSPTLLYTGPHEPRKGLDTLLRSIALLRREGVPVRLVTAGGGPQLPELQRLARTLGISDHVQFLGYVHDPDDTRLPLLYAQADIFVLPSLREGFGLVLVEAMASGLPVVATNVSSIPEVVGNDAVLVPPGDPRALAGSLHALINDPKLRTDLGERGRHRIATRFGWNRVIPTLLSAYEDAIRLARPS